MHATKPRQLSLIPEPCNNIGGDFMIFNANPQRMHDETKFNDIYFSVVSIVVVHACHMLLLNTVTCP